MRSRILATGAGAVIALGLASCGGSSSSSSSSSGGGGGCAAGTAGVNVGGPGSSTVQATDNLAFSPTTVTTGVGQVVQWSNSGQVQHTVTFDGANSCLSDVSLQGGASWQVKFTQAGTYAFHCTIHPQMTGTVTVS